MPSNSYRLAALSALSLVAAAPAIYFPFNSQLPPVARISEAFSYTLSPHTFSSPSTIRYTLRGAPRWLSIDEDSGRLYGTPVDSEVPGGDVVGVPVDIVADDGAGRTAMSATLVVSRNSAPTVRIPLADQIADFGDQSAPGAIVSYPASPFAFTFDERTFAAQTPLNYYATSADSSPLPSWITFDPANLTFSGRTPPFENLIQPPQTFGFQIVASDVEGFSASSIVFSIVVGSRKLTINNPVVQLNTTRGSTVSYSRLASDIKLDGKQVQSSELEISTQGFPAWLSIDKGSLEIKGDVPRDAKSSNATLIFRNSLSDSLSVQLQLLVETGIFRKTLSNVDATLTKEFKLDLESYFWKPKDVSITVKTEPNQDWLKADGLVLSGTPPESAGKREGVRLSVKAVMDDTGDSETEEVKLRVLAATETGSTTRTTTPLPTQNDDGDDNDGPGTMSTETPKESGPAAAHSEFGDGLNGGQIALAVILPILIIATLVAIFILLRRRREKKFRKIETKDISGPLPGTFVQKNGPDDCDPSVAETVKVFQAIPAPEPAYRPGQRGYLRAALRRMRSTRTASSFDSDSQGSFTLAPPMLPRLRSVSDNAISESRHSWLTEEGFIGRGASQRHSRNSILSVYDSIRDFPSRRRYMRAQTESSWRSTLDVTIPMMEDDHASLHPASDAGYPVDKAAVGLGDPEKQAGRRDDSLFIVPPPPEMEKHPTPKMPEQRSALGSHPTHGKRFTPEAGAFMIYKDNLDARDSQVTVGTASVFGLEGLARQPSRGSELSHIRPVSRRSDASPWFGSRAVMPTRSPFAKRHQFDAMSSEGVPSMPAMPSAALSPSVSGFASSSVDQEPNWRTISRDSDSAFHSTGDWQTIHDRRSSLDMAYEDLIRQSPFYPRSSAVPPRPVKSAKRGLADAQENQYVVSPKVKDKSWMGKGVSLRPRPLQQSDSNTSLMSPSKWNAAASKKADRPVSSIRHVRSSAKSGLLLDPTSDYPSARNSRGMPVDSDESSGWTTDGASSRQNDSASVRQLREGTFGPVNDENGLAKGRKSVSEEFAVFI